MLGGMVGALIIAGILSLFGFDDMFRDAVKDVLKKNISRGTYYMVFAVIGMISGLFGI